MKRWKFWLADILTIADLMAIFIIAFHYLGYFALLWWCCYNLAYWIWLGRQTKLLRKQFNDELLKMCEKPKGRWE